MTNILDCTLRDGGYYTLWKFTSSFVDNYLQAVYYSGINWVELGYSSPGRTGEFANICKRRTAYHFAEYEDSRWNLGFMIDLNEFYNFSVGLNRRLLEEYVPPKKENFFNFIRIAVHPNDTDLEHLGAAIDHAEKMRYKVFVNVMHGHKVNRDFLLKLKKVLEDKNVVAVCVADSFGCMTPKEVKFLCNGFNHYLQNKKIGVHLHDNMGLAFANGLAVLDDVDSIDCTVTGMGRGAGNLKTEQLTEYLEGYDNVFNDFIETYLSADEDTDLQECAIQWGSNIKYFVGAFNKMHPNKVKEFKNYNALKESLSGS